ncbi:hypothetical protein ACFWUQ_06985 [Streptomyces sp. NPDC058662]|uniref:hypothetical protein n=1 Tax=Streptomyces sp. NPDC058662 TaxID=3346583 RepID=UPI0036587CBF
MITQGVEAAGRCGACGGPTVRDIGQFIDHGRLRWGIEETCRACPSYSCAEDDGPVTPEWIRDALLAAHGPARLRLTGCGTSPVPAMKVLRSVHRLTLAQAREMANRLADTGLLGTLVEMEFLAARLRHASVGATVEHPAT